VIGVPTVPFVGQVRVNEVPRAGGGGGGGGHRSGVCRSGGAGS
jgi:hypothetical protein